MVNKPILHRYSESSVSTKRQGHESKEFFIDGKMYLIEPFRGSDNLMDITLQELQNLPDYYKYGNLKHDLDATVSELCKANDNETEVLKATYESEQSETVGFAIYHLNKVRACHEMLILVKTKYVATRLVNELMDSLIREAHTHGVTFLYTTDKNQDVFIEKLASKYSMLKQQETADTNEILYSLRVDDQPALIYKHVYK